MVESSPATKPDGSLAGDTASMHSFAWAGGAGGGKGGKVTVPETLPADVKTQSQLMDYLLKLGVPADTDEFDTAFGKLGKGLPLR